MNWRGVAKPLQTGILGDRDGAIGQSREHIFPRPTGDADALNLVGTNVLTSARR